MDKYYLHINLQRWAIVQYSIRIWRKPKLKEHLAKNSVKCESIYERDTMPIELHEELNNLILPSQLKDELKLAIGTLGTRIRMWLQTYSNKINDATWIDIVDYIDHIHWSHLGCIDSVKTTETLYKLGLLPMTKRTWQWLCEHCVEECIEHFWEKMTRNSEYNDLTKHLSSGFFDDDEYICDYWRLRMEDNLNLFRNSMIDFDYSETVDEYMFKRSTEAYHNSLIYFWKRIDDDYKKNMLHQIAEWKMYEIEWSVVYVEQNFNFLMFIIAQYLAFGFEKVLTEMLMSPWLLAAMLIWPFNNNFVSVREEFSNYGNDASWEFIVHHLLELMSLERAYIGHDARTRGLFYYFWDHNIENFREDIIHSVDDIWRRRDMKLLKYIVVHQKSSESRFELLDHIAQIRGYSYHLNLKFLKEFIKQVSQDVDVVDWFTEKFAKRGINLILD